VGAAALTDVPRTPDVRGLVAGAGDQAGAVLEAVAAPAATAGAGTEVDGGEGAGDGTEVAATPDGGSPPARAPAVVGGPGGSGRHAADAAEAVEVFPARVQTTTSGSGKVTVKAWSVWPGANWLGSRSR
jgi:hypothetical protein